MNDLNKNSLVVSLVVTFGIWLNIGSFADAAPILASQGLGTSAYTSSSDLNASYTASKAFDGDAVGTRWISSAVPTQWIEVDLGTPYDLDHIDITANETRTAATYEIWVSKNPIGSNTSGATLINTVTGAHTNREVLTCSLLEPLHRRYVQVRTTALDPNGYAAFWEIEVYRAAPILVSQGLDASAYTSSSDLNASYTAPKAFDGDAVTKWIASAVPTQWIEVNLGTPYDLDLIELTAEGDKTAVTHEIWVSSSPIGSDTNGATLMNTLTGAQTSGGVLTSLLFEPTDRQYVQVRTTAWSPDGFVSWRELQVYRAIPEPPPAGTLIIIQ